MQQQRQSKTTFWEMLEKLTPKVTRHDDGGEEVIQASACGKALPSLVESQATSAYDRDRALTSVEGLPSTVEDLSSTALMEQVCEPANLNRAYARVKANKGAPGIDGMSVDRLAGWIRQHKQPLIASLLDGSYQPQPVRGVQIPKPGGGMRQLGIPTVIDRLVQQAMLQVLEGILDPNFSESSYGFRPGRSAHDALRKAKEFVAGGRDIVVDIDLEKFFDRVNHDILMNRLSQHVSDKRMLKIIGRFLRAGMMSNGVCLDREEGTPQGGPLSPLLANLLLDDLDKELERRGHCFCRYADDCNIYVQSQAAGERVMTGVTRFLEQRLRLRVNRDKSAVAFVRERKFLGHRLLPGGHMGIAPQSLARAKQRVRQITRRSRGVAMCQVIDGGALWAQHLPHRLGDVLPLRGMQKPAARAGWLGASKAAMPAPQAVPLHETHCRLAAEAGRASSARLAAGAKRQGMVAAGRQPSGNGRDVGGVVRVAGLDHPDREV